MPNRESARSARKPPPNYNSRRVQLRLLMLVSLFMLVLFMMEEARKPEYYRWMWGGRSEAGDADLEAAGDIDTRLNRPDGSAGGPGPRERAPGQFTVADQPYDPQTRAAAEQRVAERRQDDPLSRAAVDAWGRMLAALSVEQRQTLDTALLRRRQGGEMPETKLAILHSTLRTLQRSFSDYLQRARQRLADESELREDQLATWHSVLDRLEVVWSQEWSPALQSLADSPRFDSPHRAGLDRIQELIDELNLAAIRDSAVTRPAERFAWHRFFERLQSASPEDLQTESIGVISFLQLHEQPEDYRGDVVTLHGRAKFGYRVPARENILGLDEYRLLWLRPSGGPNTLVAVYCLESPGLPPLNHVNDGEAATMLDHEVVVTGYFFKKWAYRAQDGLRTAPQILAKTVEVESAPPPWETETPPAPRTLLVAAVGAAVLGVLIAVVLYRLYQGPSRAADVATQSRDQVAFDVGQVRPDVAEQLRALEQTESPDDRR